MGNKTSNISDLLCAGEPNTEIAIAHIWSEPIKPSLPTSFASEWLRSADVPSLALVFQIQDSTAWIQAGSLCSALP